MRSVLKPSYPLHKCANDLNILSPLSLSPSLAHSSLITLLPLLGPPVGGGAHVVCSLITHVPLLLHGRRVLPLPHALHLRDRGTRAHRRPGVDLVQRLLSVCLQRKHAIFVSCEGEGGESLLV